MVNKCPIGDRASVSVRRVPACHFTVTFKPVSVEGLMVRSPSVIPVCHRLTFTKLYFDELGVVF